MTNAEKYDYTTNSYKYEKLNNSALYLLKYMIIPLWLYKLIKRKIERKYGNAK